MFASHEFGNIIKCIVIVGLAVYLFLLGLDWYDAVVGHEMSSMEFFTGYWESMRTTVMEEWWPFIQSYLPDSGASE